MPEHEFVVHKDVYVAMRDGVHLPGDVIAGWVAGSVAAAVAWTGVIRLSERFGILQEHSAAAQSRARA